MKSRPLVAAAAVLLISVAGCSQDRRTDPNAVSATTIPVSKGPEEPLPPEASPFDALPPALANVLDARFNGDLDALLERRLIRVGTVFNRTHYFIDKGLPRGLTYEAFKRFEDDLNKRLRTGLLKVHVVMMPLARDQLFPALEAGKVDLVAAALTVTPGRQRLVAFSTPTRTNVSEIVVTAPGVPAVTTPDNLSGRTVFVRKSSSYYESLVELNRSLASRHQRLVDITEAPEALEDDDVLEMVNAGLVDVTVMDDFMVEFWRRVFPNVQPQPAAVRIGGELAIGIRRSNPQLRENLNAWIRQVGTRSAFANTLNQRYLQDTTFVTTATAEAERKKLQTLAALFQTYGDRYKVDYLLVAAQGYQESRLDQSARSQVGAIGVMQIMPSTGKQLAVGDITQTEANIHAGVKYFRFMMDEFYKDEPMDDLNKGLMTMASYNAGPGRMRQLRRETAKRGLDPNRWFGNVERVVSERIGRETVTYVNNIYKYYVAYRLVLDRQADRQRAREYLEK